MPSYTGQLPQVADRARLDVESLPKNNCICIPFQRNKSIYPTTRSSRKFIWFPSPRRRLPLPLPQFDRSRPPLPVRDRSPLAEILADHQQPSPNAHERSPILYPRAHDYHPSVPTAHRIILHCVAGGRPHGRHILAHHNPLAHTRIALFHDFLRVVWVPKGLTNTDLHTKGTVQKTSSAELGTRNTSPDEC
jgi:hypothetical protein